MAKIMVVDDAPEVIQFITQILKSAHHEVIGAQSAAGVEDRIQGESPDVLLLDIVMPERNGFSVLRELKKRGLTKTTPVVLVSSKDQKADIDWGLFQGAADYLTKPFTPDQLLAMVGRHTRR